MKKTFLFSFAFVMILSACSDSGTKDTAGAKKDEAESAAPQSGNSKTGKVLASEKFINLEGETDIEKLLCQGWVMDDDVDILESNNEPEGPYPYRCFYFFDDHTYTRNVRNAMEYGTWQYEADKKTVSVKSNAGAKDMYKIAAIGPGDMVILNSSAGSATKLTYLADGVRYKDKNDDPFYIENNRWRISPSSSETEEQVRKRLKQCVWFHILFYRDNLAKKERLISFYGFPTCIKWYGGGIGLIKTDELPDNWYACFYNKEQALRAQKIMGGIISKKYKWSTGKINWVQKNLEVLEQMYTNL
jgi:hypothetical protein